jgi:4-amino-4-deoxy-L-arabinose transferase-like glycosyltransferase
MHKKDCKIIFVLFVASLFVRLLVLWMYPNAHLGSNAIEAYIGGAKKIITGTGFSDPSYPVFTPPLYATLIAAIFHAFGETLLPIKILQCILDSIIVVMILFIAGKIFGPKTANLSGILLAVYPFIIFPATYIGSETLFTFFLSFFILLSLYAIEYEVWYYYVAAGIILGLATLTRGTTQFYPIFFLLCLIIMGKFRRSMLLNFVTFCLSFILVIIPWTIRNYVVLNAFIPVALTGSVLLQGSSEEFLTISGKNNEYPKYFELLKSRGIERPRNGNPVEMNKFLTNAGLERYKIRFENNPFSIVSFTIKKFFRMWYATESGRNHVRILAINMPFYLLSIIGIVMALLTKKDKSFVILGVLIYFILIHLITLPLFRYIVPVVPYIIIFAAFAVTSLWERYQNAGLR